MSPVGSAVDHCPRGGAEGVFVIKEEGGAGLRVGRGPNVVDRGEEAAGSSLGCGGAFWEERGSDAGAAGEGDGSEHR